MALRSVNGQVIEQPRNETGHWLLQTVHSQAEEQDYLCQQLPIYHSADVNAATVRQKEFTCYIEITGLLNLMTRDEAEAVLAHEVSHIKSSDMVTMTLLQGVLNTFVIFISRMLAKSCCYRS